VSGAKDPDINLNIAKSLHAELVGSTLTVLRQAHHEVCSTNRLPSPPQSFPARKPMRFKARIIEATPPRALAWKGRIVIPGLFDVSHHFADRPVRCR
jgi:hypothetical protein